MFKRILVPVDFSDIGENATAWAESVAAATGAELFLLHVVQPLSGGVAARPTPTLLAAAAREEQRQLAKATTTLSNGVHALHARDLRASRYVETGAAALKILEFIDKHTIDLVVMGTHGRGGMTRAVLGSVADEVRRETRVPVLLVPSAAAPPVGRHQLLICLDESPGAESAFEAGVTLARALDARVMCMEVIDGLGSLESATKYLSSVTEIAKDAGLEANSVVGRGEPGPDILLNADIVQATVIALASHGRSGLARSLLGSVASYVLTHSHVAVLLTHRVVAKSDEVGALVASTSSHGVAT